MPSQRAPQYATFLSTDMKKKHKGFIMLLALVFGAIFLLVLSGLSSYVVVEHKITNQRQQMSESFAIAEAGLEYYRWHLAHFPTDLQNGTGAPGPYPITIPDPQGSTAGVATLSITANTSCGLSTSINLSSSGQAAAGGPPVVLTAKYAQPTVALYSYVLNDNVWAGADRVISGPYHSNGGIRMDGTANAPVTSSVATWSCTSSFGCSPTATKAGVWGAGPNQTLWSYPVPQVDFAAIAADFSTLKTLATASGIYLPRFSAGNKNSAAYYRGYHLIFNANDTVTVRRVTSTTSLNSTPINPADDTDNLADRMLINNETNFNTYTIPSTCGLMFVEDNTWIEGTIPSKVTVVVANVADSGVDPSAYLRGNITYEDTDGSDGITVIAERNVLITPDAPSTMTLNGIFIAQNGAFGRNLYSCPSSYEPKTSLTILGTTVSNKRTGTKWVNGCPSTDAGYQTRIDAFDRKLASDPPPFTPVVSTDYELMDWRQK